MLNLESYALRDIQHTMHILQLFEINDMRDVELIKKRLQDIVQLRYADKRKNVKILNNLRICPQCSSRDTILLPVNDNPSTMVGGSFKSVFLCKKCFYEKYNIKTITQLMGGE